MSSQPHLSFPLLQGLFSCLPPQPISSLRAAVSFFLCPTPILLYSPAILLFTHLSPILSPWPLAIASKHIQGSSKRQQIIVLEIPSEDLWWELISRTDSRDVL